MGPKATGKRASRSEDGSSEGLTRMTKITSKLNALGGRPVSETEMQNLKKEAMFDDHLIALDAFCLRYHTDPDGGLSSVRAQQLLDRDGLNRLTPPRQTPEILKFFKHMFSGFAMILWFGAFLTFLAYEIELSSYDEASTNHIYLGTIILIVVVASGIFSYVQDRSSSKIMDSFQKMVTQTATVIRDGKVQNINAEHLVKGDVVLVKSGNKVPADIRIIECFGMKVDNSSLTGETEPQSRGVTSTNINPMETQNLAFYSTNVMEGTCKGIVFQTGDRTIIGRLATLTAGLKRVDSPLTKEIAHFVRIITVVAFVFSAMIFVAALAIGHTIIDSFIFFIAMLVANVPEGAVLFT